MNFYNIIQLVEFYDYSVSNNFLMCRELMWQEVFAKKSYQTQENNWFSSE
jgi:hypothetical protein